MCEQLLSLGFGVGTQNRQGEWLEVFYASPVLKPSAELIDIITPILGYMGGNQTIAISQKLVVHLQCALKGVDAEQHRLLSRLAETRRPLVVSLITTDEAPTTVPEAYLKLHLLSQRLVQPHGINLDGIFGLLPNVAWTNEGAIDLEELAEYQLERRVKGDPLHVYAVDKFPPMADYVVPSGVRIADTSRIRLGAYLGAGTTVMHEGFVNFNAGTEGPAMVEGRISAGVWVGKNSDLGGGCSTMGLLSGGGTELISVGENCLIGANAGTGIPLGNRCTIESGLYITAGTKVNLLDAQGQPLRVVKARELSKQDDLLFRRNSLTGAIECLPQRQAISLNADLHQ